MTSKTESFLKRGASQMRMVSIMLACALAGAAGAQTTAKSSSETHLLAALRKAPRQPSSPRYGARNCRGCSRSG